MSALTLGQPVRFTEGDVLLRRYHDGAKAWRSTRALQPWSHTLDEPVEGVLVGLRTLSNGPVEYGYDEITYRPKEFVSAVLVAVHLRRRPVLLRIEDVAGR